MYQSVFIHWEVEEEGGVVTYTSIIEVAKFIHGLYLAVFTLVIEPSRTDGDIAFGWCPLVTVFPTVLQLLVVRVTWINGVGRYHRPTGLACKSAFVAHPSATWSSVAEDGCLRL